METPRAESACRAQRSVKYSSKQSAAEDQAQENHARGEGKDGVESAAHLIGTNCGALKSPDMNLARRQIL